jgi:outer membrane biosynthesis protein TonB
MSSNARIFFAGVGTTFVILAVGFGTGLMMASSTLQGTIGRAGSNSERLASVRVILPASAEPAQPPQPLQPEQPTTTAIPAPESQPQAQQIREVQVPLEKQVEKPDTRRAEAEQRERRRRSAERKAKKLATARARQQFEQQSREREPGIMAFGGNEQPRLIGFLGN